MEKERFLRSLGATRAEDTKENDGQGVPMAGGPFWRWPWVQHLQRDGLPQEVTVMEFHLRVGDSGLCTDEIVDELQGFGRPSLEAPGMRNIC